MKRVLIIAFLVLLPVLAMADDYPRICLEAEELGQLPSTDPDKLLDMYDQCLAHDLNDAQRGSIFFNISIIHQTEGHLQKALEYLDRCIRYNPHDFMAYNNRAWILASSPDSTLRDPEQALSDARKASALSADIVTLDTLAVTLARVGRYGEAADLQQELVDAVRDMPQVPPGLVEEMVERLRLYRNGEPYTEEEPSTSMPGGQAT